MKKKGLGPKGIALFSEPSSKPSAVSWNALVTGYNSDRAYVQAKQETKQLMKNFVSTSLRTR